MKFAVFLCVISFVVIVTADKQKDEKYTTKYDNIEVDKILNNDRLLRNYVDCLVHGTHCTKDGEVLKKVLSEALKTKCEKCSEKQKKEAVKVITFLLKNKRDWWNEIEAAYDPNHVYREVYKKEIKDAGIQF
uniref:Chemosensory protein 12 n=1 Tax=Ophraella communa TaxID=38162 RepID=A0A5B9GBQ4_9CUCU|nr:chemosensory protein 12 [Ophraella communa]